MKRWWEKEKRDKKGLSTIIVTLIVILISLVAVGIIWVVVRNVIQSGTEGVSFGQFTLDAKIMSASVDNSTNNISLIVKRNAGQGELVGIKFVFSDGKNSEIITEEFSMNELEQKGFTFHLNDLNVSNIKTISIVSLIRQDEKDVVGSTLDKYNVGGEKQTSSSCTPTNCSNLGYLCGTWTNGSCSGTLDCGTCTGGQTCNSSGRCAASCAPQTCASLGYQCGSGYANGTCGGTLNCGSCSGGFSCNASGRCAASCAPQTCASLGYQCGSGYANGTCGGTLNCGSCSGGQTCNVSGQCVDTTAPVRYNGAPFGILAAGTTSTNVSLMTDEFSRCRYSTTAGTPYSSMVNNLTGLFTHLSHSRIISGLQNGISYNYYVRCNDTLGNVNTNDYSINFSVANPSCTPATCASLGYTCGTWANGTCSGTLNCGSCSGGYNCVGGTCQAAAGLCSNLLLLMHFDANSSTVIDSSIYANNGAVNGAIWTSAGRFSGAFTYNGTNSITVPASRYNFANNTITMSTWIYPTYMNTYACVVGASDSQFWFGPHSATDVAVYWENVGWRGGIGTPVTLNTWSHIVGVIDNKIGRYYTYVNGILVVNVSDAIPMKNTNPSIGIGSCNGQYFFGRIDDVAVWNRTLTSAEISSIYSSGTAISC